MTSAGRTKRRRSIAGDNGRMRLFFLQTPVHRHDDSQKFRLRSARAGDPVALDCCPEECLVKYLERRRTGNTRQAIHEFFASGCYPHLDDPVDEGAP